MAVACAPRSLIRQTTDPSQLSSAVCATTETWASAATFKLSISRDSAVSWRCRATLGDALLIAQSGQDFTALGLKDFFQVTVFDGLRQGLDLVRTARM